MAYNELCAEEEAGGWKMQWDEESRTPFYINGDRVVALDNMKSFEEKVRFILLNT